MLTLVIRNALAERIAKIAAVKTKFAKGLSEQYSTEVALNNFWWICIRHV